MIQQQTTTPDPLTGDPQAPEVRSLTEAIQPRRTGLAFPH